MTTPALLGHTMTARVFLLEDAEGQLALDEALASPEVAGQSLGRLTRAAGTAVQAELGTAVSGLLDFDLVDVLVHGWRRYAALTEAAHRTLAMPGRPEVVDLATHRVSLEHTPRVDVLVDGMAVAHIDVSLSVAFDIVGLAATVQAGALVQLHGGACTTTARLTVEGFEIASRKAGFDLRLAVPLGLPLVEPAERRTPSAGYGESAGSAVLPAARLP